MATAQWLFFPQVPPREQESVSWPAISPYLWLDIHDTAGTIADHLATKPAGGKRDEGSFPTPVHALFLAPVVIVRSGPDEPWRFVSSYAWASIAWSQIRLVSLSIPTRRHHRQGLVQTICHQQVQASRQAQQARKSSPYAGATFPAPVCGLSTLCNGGEQVEKWDRKRHGQVAQSSCHAWPTAGHGTSTRHSQRSSDRRGFAQISRAQCLKPGPRKGRSVSANRGLDEC
ncbi:hypothetical protein BKA56DRAFT_138487 [Ilyonectria sp. MPI-CAGE-AT-0026]|nr:hypothetical protein BKA56DRAFT_138487 [Ilyonectria sp. MPI-CAGE-AT-0026]